MRHDIAGGIVWSREQGGEDPVEHALQPRDWRIEDLETVARRYGIEVRKTGGSHFVFLHRSPEIAVTVPFKRPIKPVYIVQFLTLIDDIRAER